MVATLGRSPGLTTTLKRLVELLEGEDEDDYGVLKPTDYAFKSIMSLILEANSMLLGEFPKASASTDDQGGIRLAWTASDPDREVCLFCPHTAGQSMDIYHASGTMEGVEDVDSVMTLIRWLDWFNQQ
jgi:hypothetical protein